MADFLTTKMIASEIEEIIKRAKQKLYIITPYLKLSPTFSERLFEASERGIEIAFVYGKTNLSKQDQELIKNLRVNIYYKENLHAKCYANEEKALITSMNLHSFSEANNREFGTLIKKSIDNKAYLDCIEEMESVLLTSQPERLIEHQIISEKYEYIDFVFEWYKHLQKTYPETKFSIVDGIIHADSFPIPTVSFSNEYGFATLTFKLDKIDDFDLLRDAHAEKLRKALGRYRFYWNRGSANTHRICIYQGKGIEFENIKDCIEYCTVGLLATINVLNDFC